MLIIFYEKLIKNANHYEKFKFGLKFNNQTINKSIEMIIIKS